MNHRQVIERAIADRLRKLEGACDSEKDIERRRFISDTTDMILVMICRGTPDAFEDLYQSDDDEPLFI